MPKTIDKVEEIALHYGFDPAEVPLIAVEGVEKDGFLDARDSGVYFMSPFERIPVMSFYSDKMKKDKTSMFFSDGFSLRKNNRKISTPSKNKSFNLDVFGVDKGIAEAVIIQTIASVIREEGIKSFFIDLNSVGDKESVASFSKELSAYYRKNLDAVPDEYKHLLRKNVFELFNCDDESCKELRKDAPKSISFLSEDSSKHFKEVLEYLEAIEVPYRINDNLVCSDDCYSKIIFEFVDNGSNDGEEKVLGRGGRFDYLASKFLRKRVIPAVGASMNYTRLNDSRSSSVKSDPEFYFVQFGLDAKLQSLRVLEALRKCGTSVYHHIYRNKLAGQLAEAEKLGVPYIIIFGQKEVTEDSVIVRDVATRSQSTVKISKLSDYIKGLPALNR